MKTVLLNGVVEDTTGEAFGSNGSDAMFAFVGTFGGGTVTIQISLDGVVWSTLRDSSGADVEITAQVQDVYAVKIKSDYSVRAVLSGSTTPSLTVTMVQ